MDIHIFLKQDKNIPVNIKKRKAILYLIKIKYFHQKSTLCNKKIQRFRNIVQFYNLKFELLSRIYNSLLKAKNKFKKIGQQTRMRYKKVSSQMVRTT